MADMHRDHGHSSPGPGGSARKWGRLTRSLIALLSAALVTATVALPAAAQSEDDDASVTWDRDSNRDIDLHAAWNSPTAIAGIGSTMYVSMRGSSQVRAFSLEDAGAYLIGDQIHEDDIDTVAVADSHAGIWANDEHLYVVGPAAGTPAAGSAAPSGANQRRVVAFNRETGLHDSDVEIVLNPANQQPEDIWSDGETIWVLDGNFNLIFAYDLVTGDRLHSLEVVLDPLNGAGRGLWSDGAVMWVSDLSGSKLFAYSMDEDSLGERQVEHEFETDSDNDRPLGIWSDGTTMWVVDEADRKLFAYTHPGDTEETADPRVELTIPDDWGDVFEGDEVEYSLVLATAPQSDVVIDITVTGDDDISIQPTQLTFTSEDWFEPQSVTITVAEDGDNLNDSVSITHSVNAADSSDEYDDVVIDTLGLTALDNDTAGITVSVLALLINEPGSTSYTVVLDAAPASNVVIEVWKMGRGHRLRRTQPADLYVNELVRRTANRRHSDRRRRPGRRNRNRLSPCDHRRHVGQQVRQCPHRPDPGGCERHGRCGGHGRFAGIQ